MNMERTDLTIIAGAVLIPLFAALATMGIQSQMTIVMIILAATAASGLAVLGALIAIYKGRDLYGGEIARNLEIVGLGFFLFMITYVPHTVWHVVGLTNQNPLGPEWIGMSGAWWAGFFHVGAFMYFIISAYGFYRFWKPEE